MQINEKEVLTKLGMIKFYVQDFVKPDKNGKGYIGKDIGLGRGKITLPPVKEKGTYLCLNPVEKQNFYWCKRKYLIKKEKRIFGINDKIDDFLDNDLIKPEYKSEDFSLLIDVKGYKIPFIFFINCYYFERELGLGYFYNDKTFIGAAALPGAWGSIIPVIDVIEIKPA